MLLSDTHLAERWNAEGNACHCSSIGDAAALFDMVARGEMGVAELVTAARCPQGDPDSYWKTRRRADPEKAARIKLLHRGIELSGMSARQFAVQVLIRDERTIRKWLHGDSEVPDVVRDFLLIYVHEREKR